MLNLPNKLLLRISANFSSVDLMKLGNVCVRFRDIFSNNKSLAKIMANPSEVDLNDEYYIPTYLYAREIFPLMDPSKLWHCIVNGTAFLDENSSKGSECLLSADRNYHSAGFQKNYKLCQHFNNIYENLDGEKYFKMGMQVADAIKEEQNPSHEMRTSSKQKKIKV